MAQKVSYKIKKALLFSLIYIAYHLPFFALYGLSSLISFILANVGRVPTNKFVRRNLRRVFPEKTTKEVKKISRLYYRAFGDYFIEFLKCTRFSKSQMMKRCKFKNVDLLKEKFKQHTFIICYGGHLVNYEYLVCFPLYMPDYGMCHLYLANPSDKNNGGLNWVLKVRSRYGAINIPSFSPLKKLLQLKKKLEDGKAKHKGYVFGTLSDMDTYENDPHSAPFFNRKLEVMTGAERIGRKFDMPFFYAHITRPKRGFYEIEFKEMKPLDIEINPFAYTDEFVRLLEINIRQQPELWLQWGTPRF